MRELTYTFEELPAFTELGFGFGSLDGEAVIRFDETGEWSVSEILLQGSRFDRAAGKWEYKTDALCPQSHRELFLSILDALESGARKDRIQDAVNDALEQEGVVFLSDFREHNVHHSAFSGV